MAQGHVQRRVMGLLNSVECRGRWIDTRTIANAIHHSEWASQEEVDRVRQALWRLEKSGEVACSRLFVLEWRSLRYKEVERPKMLQQAEAEFRAMARNPEQ